MIIEDVNYRINWKEFHTGYSFFIPCLRPEEHMNFIEKECQQLKFKVFIKQVIEEDVSGLRIWRI